MNKLFFAVALLITILAGCKDFLVKPPLTTLSENSYWQSGSDAEYAVNGMYDCFREMQDRVPYMDIMTDLIFLKNSWEAGFFPWTNGSMAPDNWWVEQGFWSTKYNQIRNANYFFKNIDKLKDKLTPAQMNNYKGQARVIRAFLYTRLVQGFGDVPLETEVLDVNAWPSRDKADSVISFIMSEFDQAIKELPEDASDSKHGRITKYVAYAYKARVAMYVAGFYNKPEYYQVAAAALQPIVASGKFSLFRKYNDPTRDFVELFWAANEGSENKEILFSDQALKDKRSTNISTCFAGPGWKSFQAHQNYIDMFECKHGFQAHNISFGQFNRYRDTKQLASPLKGTCPDYDPANEFGNRDARLNATFFDPHIHLEGGNIVKPGEFWTAANRNFAPDGDNDAFFFKKMVDPTNYNPAYYYGNSDNNYILVRYADVLLLYAEALNALGRTGEALPYVNDVRSRAGIPAVNTGNQQEMLEIIKHERKVELIQEQQLVWDYKRWRDYEATMPTGAIFYGYRREPFGKVSQLLEIKQLKYPKYYLWPIPTLEMQNNKNMTQNTNW
ncbi:RagB/SusD family nutrient uptake outer membrane protein [Chitinophaga arvensicola]|uniref:Starch-binding associating with outer membrane n=1 Tax=Chitinophaga arvensicola TaxID=29529 RepID=A0A1I0SD88_9BACT|nr:RagB/SusD family nutrient uptake outer membrane protein [Chitinophaga arvensicola]SEW55348.1 Starch-binding associating with outer membrane [Chitinophaga arvensicola]